MFCFFFSSRRRHTRCGRDWSSNVCSSDLAAGKTSLLDAILAMTPEEDRIQYSAMTGQSLYYLSSTDLKHKILAIAEEEGASQASYALKLLQSQGALSIASTGKDQKTGR